MVLSRHADPIIERMTRVATILGVDASTFVDCPYGGPRWRVDERTVEFECGCRAERCMVLFGATQFDPIIFRDLPEQAVYDFVCHKHRNRMDFRVRFGGFATFDQWHRDRRRRLMGKAG
jgi:hypothetical protein